MGGAETGTADLDGGGGVGTADIEFLMGALADREAASVTRCQGS
jgi:hypothetical protein